MFLDLLAFLNHKSSLDWNYYPIDVSSLDTNFKYMGLIFMLKKGKPSYTLMNFENDTIIYIKPPK